MVDVYAPPTSEVEREGPAGVRLPALRYQLLVGLLGLGAVVSAAELALCGLLAQPVLRGFDPERLARPWATDLYTWLSWSAVGSLGLFAATASVWLAWLVRARRNARALGMSARAPGVLLWWFVPGAQLVLPYMAVRALLQASRGRVPGWFATWWLVWLASSLWLCVEVALAADVGAARYLFSDEVGVVLALGLALQGLLARPLLLAVVVVIQRAQALRGAG